MSVDNPDPIMDDSAPSPPKKTRIEQLRDHLAEKRKQAEVPTTGTGKTSTLTTIQRAMATYESTGRRPHILEQIYSALSTINPSSAEAGQY